MHCHPGGPRILMRILKKKVYDVTQFMQRHPGGPQVLMARAGKNAGHYFLLYAGKTCICRGKLVYVGEHLYM